MAPDTAVVSDIVLNRYAPVSSNFSWLLSIHPPTPHPHPPTPTPILTPSPHTASQVLLNEVEAAGEEPAEGLLCARVACVATLREGTDGEETAFESFCVPPSPRRHATISRRADAASLRHCGVEGEAGAGVEGPTEGSGGCDEKGGVGVGAGVGMGVEAAAEAEAGAEAFLSFRVANKDNEVSHCFIYFLVLYFFSTLGTWSALRQTGKDIQK